MRNPIHISNFREVTLIIYHGNFVTFSVGTNGFHGSKNGGTDCSDIEIEEEEEEDDVQVLQQVFFFAIITLKILFRRKRKKEALCILHNLGYYYSEIYQGILSLSLLEFSCFLHNICTTFT